MELGREVMQQVEKAYPDRDVDHRDGLIRDDHPRIHRERARDRHALSLPTGKLVWIFEEEVRGRRQANALEQRDHRGAGGAPVCLLVLGERWRERLRDRAGRIQRRVGILMDELDRASKAREIFTLLLPDVGPLKKEPTARRSEETGEHPAGGRLSTATLADDADRLALSER